MKNKRIISLLLTLCMLAALLPATAWAVNVGGSNYMLLGTFNDWTTTADDVFSEVEGSDGSEFVLAGKVFNKDDKLQVVRKAPFVGAPKVYFPESQEDAYTVEADGVYDVHFRPNKDGGDGWYLGCIKLTGKATVKLYDIFGGLQDTKEFNVGDTFTTFTTLNTADINNGKISALDGKQEYSSSVLECLSDVLNDLDGVFPVTSDATNVSVDTDAIIFDAIRSNPFKFNNDESYLIVTQYKVKAAGDASVRTSLRSLNYLDQGEYNFIIKAGQVYGEFSSTSFFVVPTVVEYPLWVGDTEVTSECLSGEGWSFEPSTNTLTLDQFTYGGGVHDFIDSYFEDGSKAAICYLGDDALNVVVKGENSVIHSEGEPDYYCAFYSKSDTNFSGDGTLELTCEGGQGFVSALFVLGGLKINNIKLIANANLGDCFICGAIYSYGNAEFTDAEVEANVGKAKTNCNAIEVKNLTVNGGKLTARTGGSENAYSLAVLVNNTATFKNCSVDIAAGSAKIKSLGIGSSSDGKVTVEDTVKSFIAVGESAAIGSAFGTVVVSNDIVGCGWNSTEGTGDGTKIDINTTGAALSCKKVKFPFIRYDLWVGEAEVSDICTSGEGWEYDPETNTLTLDNFTYSGPGHIYKENVYLSRCGAAIYYSGSTALNVVVKDENSVTQTGGDVQLSAAIRCYSALNISGNGTLELTSGSASSRSFGLYTNSSLSVKNIKIKSHAADCYDSAGIAVDGASAEFINCETEITSGTAENISAAIETYHGSITVDGGKFTARAGSANDFSLGCNLNKTITFKNCTVDISVSNANYSHGIHADYDCKVIIEDDVKSFTVSAQSAAIGSVFGTAIVKNAIPGKGWDNAEGTGDVETIAVNTTGAALGCKKVQFPFIRYNLWIGETEVSDICTSGDGWSYEPSTNTLTLDDFRYCGAGKAFSAENKTAYAVITYLGKDALNLVVKNYVYMLQADCEADILACIYCDNDLNISGDGAMDAYGNANSPQSFGIYVSGDLSFDDCTLFACGGSYSDNSYGIYALGDFNVSGGSIIARGQSDSDNGVSVGIYAGGDLTATDGSLKSYAYYGGTFSAGIMLGSGASFDNCEVLVYGCDNQGNSYGIYGDNGSVEIKKGIKSFVAYGRNYAVKPEITVISGLAGTGWSNCFGTEGQTTITVSATGAAQSFKKIQYPHVHVYTAETVADKYFKSNADCTTAKTYYKSCSVCGLASENDTFTYGEPNGHTWTELVDDKYLVSEATCTESAVYYKSCSVCKAAGTDTFKSGEPNGHDAEHHEKVGASTSAEGVIEYWSCKTCRKLFFDENCENEITDQNDLVIPMIPEYVRDDSGDVVWVKGSGKDVILTYTRNFDKASCFIHFKGAKLGGKALVKDKDYTAKEGSTVITLKAETLEALSAGEHVFTAVFDDAESEVTLTVKEAPVSHQTGDSIVTVVFVAALALLSLAAGVYAKKKIFVK